MLSDKLPDHVISSSEAIYGIPSAGRLKGKPTVVLYHGNNSVNGNNSSYFLSSENLKDAFLLFSEGSDVFSSAHGGVNISCLLGDADADKRFNELVNDKRVLYLDDVVCDDNHNGLSGVAVPVSDLNSIDNLSLSDKNDKSYSLLVALAGSESTARHYMELLSTAPGKKSACLRLLHPFKNKNPDPAVQARLITISGDIISLSDPCLYAEGRIAVITKA